MFLVKIWRRNIHINQISLWKQQSFILYQNIFKRSSFSVQYNMLLHDKLPPPPNPVIFNFRLLISSCIIYTINSLCNGGGVWIQCINQHHACHPLVLMGVMHSKEFQEVNSEACTANEKKKFNEDWNHNKNKARRGCCGENWP